MRLSIVVAAAMPLVSACYQYVPVDTAASPVGKRVALDITDGGRVALSDRLGGGVLRLEGTVTQNDSAQYVMSVWRVAQINGDMTRWSGETVRIDRNLVGRVFERQMSRGRTYLATGVAIAAVVFFARSQGLFGTADISSSGDPPDPGPSQSRVPR